MGHCKLLGLPGELHTLVYDFIAQDVDMMGKRGPQVFLACQNDGNRLLRFNSSAIFIQLWS